jgi:isochorismate synthase
VTITDPVVAHHDPAHDLLAGYRPGAPFFFASPHGTMLADGVYFEVPHSVRAEAFPDLPGRVAAGLALAEAARLVVPHRLRRGDRLAAAPVPDARVVTGGPPSVVAVPAPATYAESVGRAVRRMRADELEKVVLSRALDLTSQAPLDPALLVRRLAARDPAGYTYAVDLGAGRTLVGASPELLVSRRGDVVTANPLAGSVPRAADPVTDRARAEALLASAKDRHEHAVVVRAVADALRPLCTDLAVPATPSLVRTASMWHLSTVVTGRTADPAVSALTLAGALHPTPAVCGTPRAAARAAIAEYEGYDRDFYTGMVGWSDIHGDGEWVVTIRCAVTQGSTVRLYAGAGVVADSDPDAELSETAAKFRTLLDGLGL